MKNILIIEGQRNVGGGQVMTRKIADALIKNKHNVTILLPNGNTPLSEYLAQYTQVSYPMAGYNRGRKTFMDLLRFCINFTTAYYSFRKFIKKLRPDILYVQAPALLPIAAIIGRQMNITVIAHLHVVHTDRKSRQLLNHFLSYHNVVTIIGVSHYTLSQLTEKNRLKAKVVHNCIDIPDLPIVNWRNKNSIQISVIAEVLRDKGQHVVVKALSLLDSYSIYYNVIGSIVEPEYATALKEECPNIRLIGRVHDVLQYIQGSYVVIVPSLVCETFSLSMVEAWSLSVPTLVSATGGMKELVDQFLPEYRNALLFEPGNASDLAEKMRTLIEDQEAYNQISRRVRDVAQQNFGFGPFAQQINNIIETAD